LILSADECIVFEDSLVGFTSASAVGLKTVVTLSEYTKPFAFDGALIVVDHLGEEDTPFELMSGKPSDHSYVNVEYLKELHEQNR
jgi:beta-phosphoglucomutase-like phosphatase (HAD superfamily)